MYFSFSSGNSSVHFGRPCHPRSTSRRVLWRSFRCVVTRRCSITPWSRSFTIITTCIFNTSRVFVTSTSVNATATTTFYWSFPFSFAIIYRVRCRSSWLCFCVWQVIIWITPFLRCGLLFCIAIIPVFLHSDRNVTKIYEY